MPAEAALGAKSLDDVIRIRIDTATVVQTFLDLLARQAEEGETRAPAKPANRALFRELAPFRLVEYAYVDEGGPTILGAYFGFPDGTLYAVGDEIPEEQVDQTVDGPVASLAPVYLYLVLEQPQPPGMVERFMRALSAHMGKSLVAVARDAAGMMTGRCYEHPDDACCGSPGDVVKCVIEANRHLSKQRVLSRYAARSESPDGRAWAQITYNFGRHVVEFASVEDRNDFVEWSRVLCEWIYARWCRWEDLGFSEILRQAEPAPLPKGEDIVPVRLLPPSKAHDGRAWQAFGGTDAASAKRFADSDACLSQEALEHSFALAREYWRYCTETIDSVEAKARQKAEAQAKRQLKTTKK